MTPQIQPKFLIDSICVFTDNTQQRQHINCQVPFKIIVSIFTPSLGPKFLSKFIFGSSAFTLAK